MWSTVSVRSRPRTAPIVSASSVLPIMCLRPSGLTAARRDRMDPCRQGVSSALTESTFSGHRPAHAGDLSVESHGIAPIAGGSALRQACPAVHGVVRAAGQHDRRLHRHARDRAWAGVLARPVGDGDRDGSRLARRRLPVDVGATHGHRSAAELADGVRRLRRRSRCPAMAVVDRMGRAGRTVRRGSTGRTCSASRSGWRC